MLRSREREMRADPENKEALIRYYKEWFRYTTPRRRFVMITLGEESLKRIGLTFEAFGVKIFSITKAVGGRTGYAVTHVPTGLAFPLRLKKKYQAINYLNCIINCVPMDWFNLNMENKGNQCRDTQEYYNRAHVRFLEGPL